MSIAVPPDAHPVDAVILWVDGDDPAHRAKLHAYLATQGQVPPHAATPTRFRSVGEIDYCVQSLLRFAPFLRRIHVVTDQQRPALFDRAAHWPAAQREKLRLVDHREVFAQHLDVLPTFNSLSIETMLFAVPGLAEHFVYLNDDFLLIKPVQPEDWFRHGRPVLRGHWRPVPHHRWSRRLRRWLQGMTGRPQRAGYHEAQALGFALVGFKDRFLALDHHPHPLRRSVLAQFYAAHAQVLAGNIAPRLRSASQHQVQALGAALELQAGGAVLEPDSRLAYFKPASTRPPRLAQALQAAEEDARVLFACVQSLDAAAPAQQAQVLQWLDRVIGRDPAGMPALPLSPEHPTVPA